MWELDLKKAEHQRIDAFELWCWRRLESPLNCKIKPVHLKGNQPWILFGRTDAEAEAPILWPPDAKNWLTGKDPDARKDWGQKEKRVSEDEMARWYHLCNGHELGQTPGDKDKEAWHAAVRGVAKSQVSLDDWTLCFKKSEIVWEDNW